MNKKIILISIFFLSIVLPVSAQDASLVADWYIMDFHSEIIVEKDSSLIVTESIVADCGNLPDKHGIFRILPTRVKIDDGSIIYNPVELISITDFFGNPLKFTAKKDPFNHTITWKIGDPNITVQGKNNYRIKYRVKNAIRFDNPEFDELYWNLNGNFWDIQIDNFDAMIFFPQEISKENTEVEYYTGTLGSKDKSLANYEWARNVLHFFALQPFTARQGVTVSVTFPKNVFTPYKLTFFDKYSWNVFLYLLPVLVFAFCLWAWKKYGDDPNLKKTVIPEFEIPENLIPVHLGGLMTNGRFKSEFVTATIIDLATRGYISIEEVKGSFLKRKDYRLRILKPDYRELSEIEKKIIGWIFMYGEEVSIIEMSRTHSSARRTEFQEIKRMSKNNLTEMGLVEKKGLLYQAGFIGAGIVLLFIIPFNPAPMIISGLILIIFSFIMPKRTLKGAELLWRIKGFKLYMNTAEKYRQQFYEKENIFEKFLPYAIVFGITKEWVKKMQDIYGVEYFKTHIPAWYIGTSLVGFDADSFSSAMSSLSSSISSNVGSASGAGGAGGAGGGGGGGGGGGW